MRERLTARISKDRQAIFEEMRAKNMGSVCGIISDILAEEDAVRRDAAARGDRHSTDEDGLPLYGRAALERRDSDADDLLSDDERLSLMLYLQDTLYRIGQEEGGSICGAHLRDVSTCRTGVSFYLQPCSVECRDPSLIGGIICVDVGLWSFAHSSNALLQMIADQPRVQMQPGRR